ncbi:hypothetical protein [Lelliottia wanjuensis]|uniref:hypothetical protein n=1 Tax=Lelliottia wanjuensis TaxID=3050585 RepID=UPI00254DDAFC|nr:hypothetical protein [Lelliottia sp. V106_16]MDK9356722.1 hypothetical protein [Lelliottia sp. V106_16]
MGKTKQSGSITEAQYKTSLACSLYEVILEKAAKECSPVLIDLISLACDLNHQTDIFLRERCGNISSLKEINIEE